MKKGEIVKAAVFIYFSNPVCSLEGRIDCLVFYLRIVVSRAFARVR